MFIISHQRMPMRIPDDITKCVCFVSIKLTGGENVGEYVPFAAGFLFLLNKEATGSII